MKGLLIKDLNLLKGQKLFFIVIIVIAIALLAGQSEPGFVIGYMTFVGGIFTLSTISYDEFDNGNAFLFSLPITRKGYVGEKYIFGIALGGALCLLALAITLVFGCVNGSFSAKETGLTGVMIFATLLFMISMMIPFQLKFGGEKGRIAMLIAVGVVILVGYLAEKIAGVFHVDMAAVFDGLSDLSMGVFIAAVYLLALVLCLISMKISVSIMEKKEF